MFPDAVIETVEPGGSEKSSRIGKEIVPPDSPDVGGGLRGIVP